MSDFRLPGDLGEVLFPSECQSHYVQLRRQQADRGKVLIYCPACARIADDRFRAMFRKVGP